MLSSSLRRVSLSLVPVPVYLLVVWVVACVSVCWGVCAWVVVIACVVFGRVVCGFVLLVLHGALHVVAPDLSSVLYFPGPCSAHVPWFSCVHVIVSRLVV